MHNSLVILIGIADLHIFVVNPVIFLAMHQMGRAAADNADHFFDLVACAAQQCFAWNKLMPPKNLKDSDYPLWRFVEKHTPDFLVLVKVAYSNMLEVPSAKLIQYPALPNLARPTQY